MTNADCIVDSFDPEVSPKNKRQLTVSYVRRLPDRRLVPAMIMKGQWLAAAGFSTGTRVEVRVMDGCIVLTAVEPEPELEAAMRRVETVAYTHLPLPPNKEEEHLAVSVPFHITTQHSGRQGL
ncbi:SymE family type I addiction module toxin [Klebsiella michiganensis]|uniref:SymE family type I addiction module toxin n=3 Tax=Klebsiella michiganensis TaxID=1134687 RepID=UPI0037C08492